ncbi:hypothetical protein [Achromobacter deleyi]|uniref:hypothetical protein n=1 Tax=Achromobacter deleyi TaxID=1353891 RepID=UPI001492BDAD|nr:hypothetical protein [Achromobacter deleyi]QVQ26163.1 hypothetical protein HLG70_25480 [Achromobacter deleyi]UIP21725.1 hypothetical protein LYZ39_04155 [Achromobacter deleyi]
MTDVYRLSWEPSGRVPEDLISNQVMKYMDNEATFAQFHAGTCLMLQPVEDLDETIAGAMKEARRIADFKVYPMKEGDYLVFFASPLLVYVGKDEFEEQKQEVVKRLEELKFPGEVIKPDAIPLGEADVLIGLYARGKLQFDAWSGGGYKIVHP